MKKLSFAAGVSAIALAVSTIFPVAGVFANTATYDGSSNIVTLERSVTNITNPVTNTFTYSVTTGADNPGTVTGYPTSATIEFNNVAPTGTTATQTTTLDFSNADFSKVGDYTFKIAETMSTDSANYPIDTAHNDYLVEVRVRYHVDANNIPDNNIYEASVAILNKDNDKVTKATWTSGAAFTYIETTAITTGNMAEKDHCFEYTISIPAAGAVTSQSAYAINSDTTCPNGATSISGGSTATVYLRHGDTLTIGQNNGANQIPVGTSYTITKVGDEEYTTKMDGTETNTVTKVTVAVDDDEFDTKNKTEIENNKQSDPLTGIVTNFWFYLILLMIGAFGIFFIIARRKNDDEEEA